MNHRRALLVFAGLVTALALGCSSAATAPAAAPAPEQPSAAATPLSQPEADSTATPVPEPTNTPLPEAAAEEAADTPAPTPTPGTQARDIPDGIPQHLMRQWETDFSKRSVPLGEIMSGGPPRDGIPPIDDPEFASVADPPEYMSENEPVIALEINGDARAYPLAILVWHEIVNDEVGGVPVTVTYCPLCNTAITFERRVGDRVLDFGTSGMLRNSDLVMWDRQTESWWQQITGEAIVGELTGTKLTFLPSPLVSWKEFVDAFPEGQVLTRNTGFSRSYNSPPYRGYDDLDNSPFLFFGETDSRLQPMERIIGLTIGEEDVAYPFELLRNSPVLHDTVGGTELVIFYTDGKESAFASRDNSERRVVGSTGVYEPVVDGEKLTFSSEDGVIKDEETGSEWNVLGQAVSGDLVGKQLPAVVHANHFWFAWQAFNPDTAVRAAEDIRG